MADKTAIKYAKPSPRSGVSLPLGAHPKNTGGKPGRSGRKPDKTIEFLRSIVEDETVQKVQMARAKAGELKIFQTALEYTTEKPAERKEITGDLTVRVTYDDD